MYLQLAVSRQGIITREQRQRKTFIAGLREAGSTAVVKLAALKPDRWRLRGQVDE
jgi:hypothetical protein